MNRRMRVLNVLSSSNQLYSGIGRAVFAFCDRLSDRVDWEFAIDDLNPASVATLRAFADPRGIPVHVGTGRKRPEALDNGNQDLPSLLREGRWDLIECVCWANGDTNKDILESIGETPLAFTPHHQPEWSVPMAGEQARFTEDVYSDTIRRSDVVLCDSTWERGEIWGKSNGRANARYVPLGCDFSAFTAGEIDRKPQLLFVGDLAEPRKRFDRVVALTQRLLPRFPDLRLVVIGNRSESAGDLIPEAIRGSCDLRGYVSETELRATYANSLGVVLLSDFEAFGIPILEAMATGTPAFFSDLEPTRGLFFGCLAAHPCPADDPDGTAERVGHVLENRAESVRLAIADRTRLASRFDWKTLAAAKWSCLAAAWSMRNCLAIGA